MKARSVRRSSTVLLAVTLLAAPARAEQGSPLQPGQRVRVAAVVPGRFTGAMVGSVVRIGPDSLTLVDPKGGGVTDLPLDSITRVEVSPRGAATLGRDCSLVRQLASLRAPSPRRVTRKWDVALPGDPTSLAVTVAGEKAGFIALGALTWGGIGAWLGHRKQSDDWSDVPVERLRLTVRPERGGGRVAFTFSF